VTVTEQDVLRIAAEAVCDPRTVRRVLAGEKVRGTVMERVRRAIEHVGVVRGEANGAVPGVKRGE
jgi:hypothetical protein